MSDAPVRCGCGITGTITGGDNDRERQETWHTADTK